METRIILDGTSQSFGLIRPSVTRSMNLRWCGDGVAHRIGATHWYTVRKLIRVCFENL